MRRVSSTLNGLANTTLQSGGVSGSAQHKSPHFKVAQYGAKTTQAYRDGAFMYSGISGQRSNWKSSASSVVSGGVPDALTANYASNGGVAHADIDDAAKLISRAAPGELVVHEGVLNKATSYTYARADNSGKKNT